MPATLAISVLLAGFQDPAPADLYKSTLPSVMTLTVTLDDGMAGGTAFLAVKEGIAVTSWHVVRGAKKVVARFSNGEEFEVSGLVDKDEKRDVALIRVKVADRPLLRFAASDPDVGAKAYIIGAPRGFEFSISDGLLSQVQILDGMRQYQFTCPASPGNSGGPLLDAKGQVLGVVAWGRTDAQNLNFAIPGTYVRALDSTLPTTPWANVVASSKAPGEGSSGAGEPIGAARYNEIVEESLYLAATGIATFQNVLETVAIKGNGFRGGVPVTYFEVINAMEAQEKLLRSIDSGKAMENAIANQLSIRLIRIRKSLVQLRLAITYAQGAEGWDARANETLKESIANLRGIGAPGTEDLEKLLADEAFLKTLPKELRLALSPMSDGTGYRLGVGVWPKNPTLLCSVSDKSFGQKLGLKVNDLLLEFDGKRVEDLGALKLGIKENLGRKVRLRIQRDGKEREIILNIPKEIPKDALTENN